MIRILSVSGTTLGYHEFLPVIVFVVHGLPLITHK